MIATAVPKFVDPPGEKLVFYNDDISSHSFCLFTIYYFSAKVMDFFVYIFLVYSFDQIVNSCFPNFIFVLPFATCVCTCVNSLGLICKGISFTNRVIFTSPLKIYFYFLTKISSTMLSRNAKIEKIKHSTPRLQSFTRPFCKLGSWMV